MWFPDPFQNPRLVGLDVVFDDRLIDQHPRSKEAAFLYRLELNELLHLVLWNKFLGRQAFEFLNLVLASKSRLFRNIIAVVFVLLCSSQSLEIWFPLSKFALLLLRIRRFLLCFCIL